MFAARGSAVLDFDLASLWGLVGALLGVFALYVAASRACRAVWDFWTYRWMTVRLAKLALVLLAVQCSLQLVWRLQG